MPARIKKTIVHHLTLGRINMDKDTKEEQDYTEQYAGIIMLRKEI